MQIENPIVRIEQLNVRVGTTNLLKNIYLQIPRNKVTVLLGPSGCGKTTLLKCLNRMTAPLPRFEGNRANFH